VLLGHATWYRDAWLRVTGSPGALGIYMNAWEGRICGRIGHALLAAIRLDPANAQAWTDALMAWGRATKAQQDSNAEGGFRGPNTADGIYASVSPFMSAERSSACFAAFRATGDEMFFSLAQADLDWIAANLWSDAEASFRYRDKVSPSGGTNFAPDVNGLLAPVYAELYEITGDAKYDELTRKIIDGATRFAYVAPANLGAQKQLNQYARGVEAIGRLLA
jgi:hypothetical protein